MSNFNQKLKEDFRNQLLEYVDLFNSAVSTQNGDWVVKRFIDIAKNIYTISIDTKVVSKIMLGKYKPHVNELTRKNYKYVLSTNCSEEVLLIGK